MINVQPFIDKLDRLGEYMEMKIDWHGLGRMIINMDALPRMPFEEIWRIYKETGMRLSGYWLCMAI